MLLTELKADLNDYLKTSPAPIPVRTLADVIAFNKAHARQEMALFGQETVREGAEDQGSRRSRLQEGARDQLSARPGRTASTGC